MLILLMRHHLHQYHHAVIALLLEILDQAHQKVKDQDQDQERINTTTIMYDYHTSFS